MTQFQNTDAGLTAFFEHELRYVKARAYDIMYNELMARTLFPVSSEVDPGAESIVYDQYDYVGVAKLIHSYASDLPSVEVTGQQFVRKIFSEGISFNYSIQDVRAARYAGKNLNDRKARAARRQMLSLENKIAFHGDEEAGIPGFITHPNIITETAGEAWTVSNQDSILADLQNMVIKQRELTKGMESGNTLLLPDEHYTIMATTRLNSTATEMTLLEYVLQRFPFITEVISCHELKGAVSGDDCAMLYRRDPEKLTLEIPQDIEFLDAQLDGFMYKVPVHARTAGVMIYCPLSIVRLDGI